MPRRPRLHLPGAFYHITLRGNHRQDIFFAPEDRITLNGIVAEVIDRFGARLHAYCLMTNHVHMLLQVGDTPLGKLMLRIASRYARQLQMRFHTKGHLFERRYHAVLVDADEYLLELLRYIHLNPVRAQMVSTPDAYLWSSHGTYVGARSEYWVTTDLALSMFHADREIARQAYRHFVDGEVGQASVSPLQHRNANDPRILGSDTFVAKLLGETWRPRSRKTLDDLITEACLKFEMTLETLASTSRQRSVTHARAWIAHQALRLRVASVAQVARAFGRDESSLRKSVALHFGLPENSITP